MADLHPFRAVRPLPDAVEEIASVPYDVIDTTEARALAEGKPKSFLHVIRPEIDLPEGTDEHADAVYAQGAANLQDHVASDYTVQEETPSVYVYRQVMDGRSQVGVFACAAVADYDAEVILKHELTRPAKEDDRTRHIVEQQAHAEPVMLTFRDTAGIMDLIETVQATEPLYDFTAADDVQHTVWRAANTEAFVDAFADIPQLYIADGHHRCKAASRAAQAVDLSEHPEARFFPAVFFPMDQMHIMAYNRVVHQLPTDAAAFLEQVEARAAVERAVDDPVPSEKGTVCLYLDGTWHRVALPEPASDRTVDALDVSRLSAAILEPLLDITDPRRDQNIDFVGGIRGTAALEQRVDSGDAALAISMYPTSIEELLAVSDEGDLMPPKSTWFEPKLRSGLLVHLF
ncbi:DUF1015 domain-containing protein [Salisaeta longa]|uniref:DUF1015 domain-containing protein n=1 Tax=Salisaeta longa TaxID=503170 RepID=UPI0003B302A0|nr:DUF1015 family protein [Salisaeta longa]